MEEGSDLLIYYSLLPCTVVLEYSGTSPDSPRLRSRVCYKEQAAELEKATGAPLRFHACAYLSHMLSSCAGCSFHTRALPAAAVVHSHEEPHQLWLPPALVALIACMCAVCETRVSRNP